MKTTYFRPSIHGWPFGNSFKYKIKYIEYEMTMGFCGGMCWTSLNEFYSGDGIPRDLPQPAQGETLYNTIFNAQKKSLSAGKIAKIFDWQKRPDLSHRLREHSLGHLTKIEWEKVQNKLDNSMPVTLTVITSSNDGNVFHLKNNHRVVAFGYKIRAIHAKEGAPDGAHSVVIINIYDPNYPMDDEVRIRFFLGGKKSNIRINQNRGDDIHGFFLDHESKKYKNNQDTNVTLESCIFDRVISPKKVVFNLKFSWQCKFIPYFNVYINGQSWMGNIKTPRARSQFQPIYKDIKQCQSIKDSLSIPLELPRKISTVAVQLLNDGDYYESVEVDALPSVDCYPYVRKRASGDAPNVCDYDLKDSDVYINNNSPSKSEIIQLDYSPFRWVLNVQKNYNDFRTNRDDMTTGFVSSFENKRIGNIVTPVYANFKPKNMAQPITTTGELKVYRNNRIINRSKISNIVRNKQKIFDGFRNNPSDFNDDLKVIFSYQFRDAYKAVVNGQVLFHGKSIICNQSSIVVSSFDFNKLKKIEGVAKDLLELGLIGVMVNPPNSWSGRKPDPKDRNLRKKLQKDQILMNVMNTNFTKMWNNKTTWKTIWKAQLECLNRQKDEMVVSLKKRPKRGFISKKIDKYQNDRLREIDSIVWRTVVDKTIVKLCKDRSFLKRLMSLK